MNRNRHISPLTGFKGLHSRLKIRNPSASNNSARIFNLETLVAANFGNRCCELLHQNVRFRKSNQLMAILFLVFTVLIGVTQSPQAQMHVSLSTPSSLTYDATVATEWFNLV